MKVHVRGKGEVSLTQANFVAQGGQASVYQRNGTAYKVYTDPKAAIPESKFHALAKISDDRVIRPSELLLDPKTDAPVGYTMRFVADTHTLCQLFTKAFRDRHGVTHDTARELVLELQERVHRVHEAGAVIVDLNELNVLVEKSLDAVYLIDVDSYQVPGFPAEVIMPSVRDYQVHGNQFTELSDWFSFAVLAFQLFIGIHPYKGTHPATKNVPPGERLEARMRQRLSAFGKDVKLPPVCYPFDVIPSVTRQWLVAVLEQGKRVPPPDPNQVPIVVAPVARPVQVAAFGELIVTEVATYDGDVLEYEERGGESLALTPKWIFRNQTRIAWELNGITLLGHTPKQNRPVALQLVNGELRLFDLAHGTESVFPLYAREIATAGGRFYVRGREQIFEVDFVEPVSVYDELTAYATHVVANVLEHASRLFEGCAIQSMLGSTFVHLFTRHHAGMQLRMPELDDYKVVDAKFEGSVLMVVGAKGGKYDRLIFRFDESFTLWDTRVESDVSDTDLNFVVTTAPVCVSVSDGKLEAFRGCKSTFGTVREVTDEAIGGDMRLVHVKGGVGFTRGNRVFSMRLK